MNGRQPLRVTAGRAPGREADPPCRRDFPRGVRRRQLRYHEDVDDGLEHTPRAFLGLLQGENKVGD